VARFVIVPNRLIRARWEDSGLVCGYAAPQVRSAASVSPACVNIHPRASFMPHHLFRSICAWPSGGAIVSSQSLSQPRDGLWSHSLLQV